MARLRSSPPTRRHAANGLESAVVAHDQVFDLEQWLPRLRRLLVDAKEHLASDHRPREPRLRRPRPGNRLDPLPAAEDRDPVGDLEHLVQLVADEDDRLSLALQALDDLEQLLRLLRSQNRRRLVEDQDLGAAVERLQDFHALLLADGDLLDSRVRIDREAERRRELADTLRRGVVVQQDAGVLRLLREHDVLRDGHDRDQHEVLVHHPDPELDRIFRRRDRDGLPAHQDLPRVGRVEPVEDAHEGRLAGPVLPQQGVDLAALEVEVDLVVREHAREALGDPAQLEDGGVVHLRAILSGKHKGRAREPALCTAYGIVTERPWAA